MDHPKQEQTLLLVKPDGVRRGLTGEVIKRIEQRGLKIVAMAMVHPTAAQMDEHYPKDEAWVKRLGEKTSSTFERYSQDVKTVMGTTDLLTIGKEVRSWLVKFMSSGPIVKAVVEGVHAVDMVRKLVGHTLPYLAEMGTIRGDYSVDSPLAANLEKRAIHNIVHASETPQEAAHEIAHWFASREIHSYRRSDEDLMF